MSSVPQKLVVPLLEVVKWIGLECLPAQDVDWVLGVSTYEVGPGEDGESRELRIELDGNSFYVDQSGLEGPALQGTLLFKGWTSDGLEPPDLLVESLTFPPPFLTAKPEKVSPDEAALKGLCLGYRRALKNKQPIGTDANPLDYIRSSLAAEELDRILSEREEKPFDFMGSIRRMCGP